MNQLVKKTITTTFFLAAFAYSMIALTPKSDAAYFQSAKSLFAQKCSVCHGNDGTGSTAKGKELKVRNWKTDPEVKKMSDAKMLEITLKGKGKMEGYEKTLGKAKVEMLIAYSKELMGK